MANRTSETYSAGKLVSTEPVVVPDALVNGDRIRDEITGAIDDLEPRLTKAAWAGADAATRWAVVRRVAIIALKAARLMLDRTESAGGDPT